MTLRPAMACVALSSIALISACSVSGGTSSAPMLPTLQASGGPVRTLSSFERTRAPDNSADRGAQITGSIDTNELAGVDDVDASGRGPELLYVSDAPPQSGPHGFVNVYKRLGPSSPVRLIGTISHLHSPTQIAIDRFANVYVVQTEQGAPVLVFKRGQVQPFRRLNTEGNLAGAIAISGDGTVYVGVSVSRILVYPPGSDAPTSTLTAYGDGPNDLFLDRDGNLYFTAVVFGDIGGIIAKFPHGSTTPTGSLGFPDAPLRAALLSDGGMAIEPLSVDRIDLFDRGSTTIAATFPIAFAQAFCLNRAESSLYSAGSGEITVYGFPNGTPGQSLSIGGVNDANFGCAGSPSKRLPVPF